MAKSLSEEELKQLEEKLLHKNNVSRMSIGLTESEDLYSVVFNLI